MMPLTLWISTIEDFLGFITRVSVLFASHKSALTNLIGFFRYFGVNVTLEYTAHSTLIHIYGSLPWEGTAFFVSAIH